MGYTGSPTFANTYITNVITASTSVFSKTCTLAAGLNVLRVTGLQTDDTALTGTLRGAYIDVSNGSTEATGTIRALELKARTEAPGDNGSKVAVLEGLSISADSKAHSVTTMRAAEFILDGVAGDGIIDEAVGLRIANNLQADKATNSYGLQIYRDSFDYTYDISLSLGGHITGNSYTNQDLRTTASPTHTDLILTDWQLNMPTYNSIHDWMNTTQSAGRISGGVISDSGDGQIDVSAGTGMIKITSETCIGVTKFIDWDTTTDITLTDDKTTYYVYITYGAGTPAVAVTKTRSDINGRTEFTLGRAYRDGTTLHIVNSGTNICNHVRDNHQRLVKVRGFERATGGVITEKNQRYLVSTDGLFYLGASPIETTGVDTSGAATFTAWAWESDVWESYSLSQIDNLNYNNLAGAGGTGSLDNLTAASHYGVHWVFIHYDSDIHVVYGQGSYKLSEAIGAPLPASLPPVVRDFAALAAKVIVLRNAPNLQSVATAYQIFFPVTAPANHSDLGNLAFADSGHTGFQAQDDVLDDLAALTAVADNQFIVGTGAGTYAHQSGATARTSLGVDAAGTAAGLVGGHEATYNHTNYNTAYNNSVTAITFNAADGIITLTQQDAGTLVTDSLDGRYFTETEIGNNYQPLHANLTNLATLSYAVASFIKMTGANTFVLRTIANVRTDLSITNVEDTQLSTWAGSGNITTVGALASGSIAVGFTSISTDYTDAKCTDATADNTADNQTSHADVVVDGDFGSNGILNRTGAGAYSILALGTDVQAYHANLAAIAAGTWTGAASITTLGTITTCGGITLADGAVIRCAGAPVLTFNDTLKIFQIDGCTGGVNVTTSGTNSQSVMYFTGYNDQAAFTPEFQVRKSHNDTLGTLTPTINTEVLGVFRFRGVDSGSAWDDGAEIMAVQNGNAGVKVPTILTLFTYSTTAANIDQLVLHNDGGIFMATLKSGTDQANAGAIANELYHDTDDNTIKIGV